MKKILSALVVCASLIAGTAAAGDAIEKLPPMNANLQEVSVSGISSGGFMASQIATAYSASVMGAGIIAAGPFYCSGVVAQDAKSLLTDAMAFCMRPALPKLSASGEKAYERAVAFAAAKKIDPVSGLARQRVYIFSGEHDKTVKTSVVDQVEKYYLKAGVPASQIMYRKIPEAGHAIVTNRRGDLACSATDSPYINNCGFFQSHELLRHIYPGKKAPPNNGALTGKLIEFDQGEFIQGTRTSMDAEAYAYIPAFCEKNRCAVHVAFHGCQQGRSKIGDRFYDGTGYNEFADANGIIVLYPQVHPSDFPPNPRGCWDFWGYSGEDQRDPDFYTRAAPQMKAVMAMVARLGQPPLHQP